MALLVWAWAGEGEKLGLLMVAEDVGRRSLWPLLSGRF